MASKITYAEILAAQQGWTEGLLKISSDYKSGGYEKAKATATEIIEQGYTYQYGPVAFKPTLAADPQAFRDTFEGALSYFVGGDPNYPNDDGFGIKPWSSTEVTNNVIQILDRNSAVSMGNVFFYNPEGEATIVDKTWGWEKYPDGSVRIHLHHSSLPYGPVSKKELPDVITGQFERRKGGSGSWDVNGGVDGGDFTGLYSFAKRDKTVTLYSDKNNNGKIDSCDLAVGFTEINQAVGKLSGWEWNSSSNTGNVFNKSGDVIGTLTALDEGIF